MRYVGRGGPDAFSRPFVNPYAIRFAIGEIRAAGLAVSVNEQTESRIYRNRPQPLFRKSALTAKPGIHFRRIDADIADKRIESVLTERRPLPEILYDH